MLRRTSPALVVAALLTALSAVAPAAADAQFAGVPRVPRRPPVAAERTVAAGDSARRDTLPPTRLPDMKAWVDSATIALGAAPADGGQAPAPRADSAGARRRSGGAARRSRDAAMRDGSRAPDTATPLPTVALAGVVTLAAGLLLRRRAAGPRA